MYAVKPQFKKTLFHFSEQYGNFSSYGVRLLNPFNYCMKCYFNPTITASHFSEQCGTFFSYGDRTYFGKQCGTFPQLWRHITQPL